eukprot:1822936-Rhodomonas_salina.1
MAAMLTTMAVVMLTTTMAETLTRKARAAVGLSGQRGSKGDPLVNLPILLAFMSTLSVYAYMRTLIRLCLSAHACLLSSICLRLSAFLYLPTPICLRTTPGAVLPLSRVRQGLRSTALGHGAARGVRY